MIRFKVSYQNMETGYYDSICVTAHSIKSAVYHAIQLCGGVAVVRVVGCLTN